MKQRATIDVICLPGDEARVFGREERHEICDVFRFCDTAQWRRIHRIGDDLSSEFIRRDTLCASLCLLPIIQSVRVDRARAHGIHGNAVGREIERRGLR